MTFEFPYQLVVFLDRSPEVGESVYYGDNGWYPQLAIKRRFKAVDIEELALIEELQRYFSYVDTFEIKLNDFTKPERMPVYVIEVYPDENLIQLHNEIIETLSNNIISRYPERDGENYYPHITAEYNDKPVIDITKYTNRTFVISSVWLLKDVNDENSVAFAKFSLGSDSE